jgi:hypothetical protein
MSGIPVAFPNWIDTDLVTATVAVAALLATTVIAWFSRRTFHESRTQRLNAMMPVVAVELITTHEEPRLTAGRKRDFGTTYIISLTNAGPGVALDVKEGGTGTRLLRRIRSRLILTSFLPR